jgi:hypothetical protein
MAQDLPKKWHMGSSHTSLAEESCVCSCFSSPARSAKSSGSSPSVPCCWDLTSAISARNWVTSALSLSNLCLGDSMSPVKRGVSGFVGRSNYSITNHLLGQPTTWDLYGTPFHTLSAWIELRQSQRSLQSNVSQNSLFLQPHVLMPQYKLVRGFFFTTLRESNIKKKSFKDIEVLARSVLGRTLASGRKL